MLVIGVKKQLNCLERTILHENLPAALRFILTLGNELLNFAKIMMSK